MPRRTSQEEDSTEDESGEGADDPDADSLLESMVEMTGQLDLDDMGFWDFHGHSSGLSFIRRMRQRYGDLMGPDSKYTPFVMPKAMAQVDRPSSRTPHGRPPDDGGGGPNVADLPPKPVAQALVSNAIDDGCAVLLFVHRPTFDALFARIYDQPAARYGDEEHRFLPLLYAVLALGCLFAKAEQSELAQGGYVRAISQG